MYPPPSGLHAMRCLYGIGRDSWVWDMAITRWQDVHSSHGVGVRSQSVVWPLAGKYSRRRPDEIIVVVVVVVEQTMYSIYNIIVGRGCRGVRVSPRRGAHFCSFWCSRLGKVMALQNASLPTTNRAARSIRKKSYFQQQ